ncbi:MAG: efflux RND transporter periplasmic adaptor subunit [Candidatus Latescibacteria bacterium]|jgi:HlyD family secretion protein|nr:efflux RND transporter periplasmic adaptor subunit [Candidatus Latescibacterota bacterium]
MKKFLIILGVILISTLSFGLLKLKNGANIRSSFEYAEISRGDLENVISSTGTLEPVGTIEVGTQVSGIIDRVYVDFNDTVQKGQILAVLDTTFLAASVRDANAGIVKAQAQYEQSVKEYERNRELYEKNFISEFDLITIETSMKINNANLLSAQTALERAQTHFDYAIIRSPISGKVIFRNVEEGQTVAASFQTPTLFVIAEDLSQMEIHALVDESDIGQVEQDQPVRFTVEAYFDETFYGTVREIWLQPETIQNVVNYTVVVDADNSEGLLLPGMTATVDFFIERKENVFLVPNAALSLQPTQVMIEEIRQNIKEHGSTRPDDEKINKNFKGERNQARNVQNNETQENIARLWIQDDDGKINVSPVVVGSTDGRMTEIAANDKIYEGMQVISGTGQKSEKNNSSNNMQNMKMMGRMLR